MSDRKGVARFTPLIVACLVAVLFVVIGTLDRFRVLNSNPCDMTYAYREKTLVKLSVESPFKLWKVSNARVSKVNPQPVLFIHGYLGSPDQARSLASQMHNTKDYFQYYAVDFGIDQSAFHASSILAQAAFVNEALAKIGELYNISEGSPQKIQVVAHSLGGIVARSAVTLSNHPSGCLVSDILLLSSPNIKSPYVPDASLDALFTSVNKAWILSFYNTSQPCQTAHVLAGLGAGGRKSALSADYLCPICAPHIRLVSISGGDIDMQVDPRLTPLFDIAARPRNTSLDVPRKAPVSTIKRLTALGAVVPNFVISLPLRSYRAVTGMFAGSAANGTAIANNGTQAVNASTVCVAGESGDGQCSVDTPPPVAAAPPRVQPNISDPRYASITPEDWSASILPYLEPHFLSLRTTQLKGVGFPIDHTAVLWCHQLLQVVTRGMEKLAKAPVGSSVRLPSLFPVRAANVSAIVREVSQLEIDQLTRYVQRNESQLAFHAANSDDDNFVRSVLKSDLRALAVTFVTRHLLKVAVCFIVIQLLAICSVVLRSLSDLLSSPIPAATGINLSLPWTHSGLELLYPAFLNVLQKMLPAEAIPAVLLLSKRVLVASLLVKAAFDWWWSPVDFGKNYTVSAFWALAYLLAVVLRSAVLLVLYLVRALSNIGYTVLRTTLRLTIWNQFVRRSVRRVLKNAQVASFVAFLRRMFLPSLIGAVWVFVYLKTNHRIASPGCELGAAAYGLSVLSVVSYAALVGSLLVSLAWYPFTAKAEPLHYHHFTELLVLYLPTAALAFPSFLFAFKLLFDPVGQFHQAAGLFSLFGPDRINYCLCNVFVSAHLYLARSKLMLDGMTPLTWLQELVGPSALSEAAKVHPYNDSTGVFSAFRVNGIKSSSAACVHEDGGANAIFERIDTDSDLGRSVQSVSNGVLLGPTYRVVHCSCATNPRLKFLSEWCEWCQCRKCGGKHLPPEPSSRGEDVNDFSVDLLLVAALLGAAGVTVLRVEEKPYLALYHIGAAAAAHVFTYLVRGINLKKLGLM